MGRGETHKLKGEPVKREEQAGVISERLVRAGMKEPDHLDDDRQGAPFVEKGESPPVKGMPPYVVIGMGFVVFGLELAGEMVILGRNVCREVIRKVVAKILVFHYDRGCSGVKPEGSPLWVKEELAFRKDWQLFFFCRYT